jgi:hypothetical protein
MSILLLLACAGRGSNVDSADTGLPDLEVPEDNIGNVLGSCDGAQPDPGDYPNQLVAGTELQRVVLADPSAVCNDGS